MQSLVLPAFPQHSCIREAAVCLCVLFWFHSPVSILMLCSAESELHLNTTWHSLALTGLGGWALVSYQVKDADNTSMEILASMCNISVYWSYLSCGISSNILLKVRSFAVKEEERGTNVVHLCIKDPNFSSFQFLLETSRLSELCPFYLGISAFFRFSAQGQISSSVRKTVIRVVLPCFHAFGLKWLYMLHAELL